ncbi:putative mediator of RNA polymerase II transcription subunit [Sesbania bispinosa]|nr:putative mediator of RNA polymerase II transcription subunit [Sesbania bispinosa]
MIYPPKNVDAEKELVDIEIKEAVDMFQQCLSLRTNRKSGLTWVALDAQSRNPAG